MSSLAADPHLTTFYRLVMRIGTAMIGEGLHRVLADQEKPDRRTCLLPTRPGLWPAWKVVNPRTLFSGFFSRIEMILREPAIFYPKMTNSSCFW